MNNKNNRKKNNNFKKGFTITLLIITMIVITTLILLWYFNNKTKVTEPQFRQALRDDKYKGSEIKSWNNTKVELGDNTVVVTGVWVTDNKKLIKFYTEIARSAFDYADSIHHLMISKNIAFYQQDRTFVPFWQNMLFQLGIFVLLFGLPMFFIIRMSKGSSGISSPFSMGKSRAKQIFSNVKFSDVAGVEEEKVELSELVDYLKNSEKYIKHGARIPCGVLMEGPPGTGKTLLAKAIAGEANVPFFSISGSEFEEVFVGVGASRIREMFILAKKNSPSIIFIDEIDAVGRKRGTSFGASPNEQTLNQLLVEMDGFGTDSSVIVMAATNRVDVLDNALLRPGRFDRQIQIPLPDVRARESILKLHARNKKVSKTISFKRIAQRTPGFSGAQLENVLNEAIILSIREKRKEIILSNIDEAIDRVIAGPAKKSRAMTLRDKKIVSYHEAGHAVIGLKVENASKVQKVTIIPRGSAGGYTIMTPKEDIVFYSKEQLFATVKGFLGGRAAEQIIFGENQVTTGAHDDLAKATNITRKMITQYGMTELGLTQFENPKQEALGIRPKISQELEKKIDIKVKNLLDECFKESLEIISSNRKLLNLLAESLRVLETITSEQIDYINKNLKLPIEVIKAKEQQEEYDKKYKNGDIFKVSPTDFFNNDKKTNVKSDNSTKPKDSKKEDKDKNKIK